MFVFGSSISGDSAERTSTLTGELCECTGHAAMSPDHLFQMKELGEATMVSTAHLAGAVRAPLG